MVYGIITTAETASSVPSSHIALTLIGYAIVYALLLTSYMIVVTQLARKEAGGEVIRAGPIAGPGLAG